MKRFVVYYLIVLGCLLASHNNSFGQAVYPVKRGADSISAEPPRPKGQTDVIALRCDPIPVVRVAFIGLGMRGPGAVSRFMYIDGIEVKAICDLEPYNIDRVKEILKRNNRPEPATYSGEEGWKKVCERDDIDLVYVCTHWRMHTPIAVYAMEKGKHVAVEVPIACTMEECWQLVNTAERTRRHCMQLENCCYDFFEMATLNMAQKGLFGEVVHVEGAYIHDLRKLNFDPRLKEGESYNPGGGETNSKIPSPLGYWNYWRLKENTENNGNLYPTHGLGPVCQILNIHRGDKMDFLVSLSSNQFSMTNYAKQRFGEDSPEATTEYRNGDMNTTLVKTAKGKSILIQHDVASPRPYSRIHTVSGTKGFAQKYPKEQLAFEPNAHSALNNENMQATLSKYEHPITKEVGDLARKVGGHGGMDFIMDYRLIYCLQNGLPLDMDVYDAAEWSCISPLSQYSVTHGSFPVKVPDFTRGAWEKIQGFQHAFKK